MLRNKSTSKVFRDAIGSPLGSTARDKAQKIFRIMDKLQASYDGVGGRGVASQSYNEPSSATNYSPPRAADNQNIVVFGKLPPMNIAYRKKIQGDGVGGPGYDYGSSSLTGGLGMASLYPNVGLSSGSGYDRGAGRLSLDPNTGRLRNVATGDYNDYFNYLNPPISPTYGSPGASLNLDIPKPQTSDTILSVARGEPSDDSGRAPFSIKGAIDPVTGKSTQPSWLPSRADVVRSYREMGLTPPPERSWREEAEMFRKLDSGPDKKTQAEPEKTDVDLRTDLETELDKRYTQLANQKRWGTDAELAAYLGIDIKDIDWKRVESIMAAGRTSVDTPTPARFTSSDSRTLTGTSRTDRHDNPTAFTTDVAEQAKLELDVDYEQGSPFTVIDRDAPGGKRTLYTATLLGGDPVATTIAVIDNLGFYTENGDPRWGSVPTIPEIEDWDDLDSDGKAAIIQKMYEWENAGLDSQTGLDPQDDSVIPGDDYPAAQEAADKDWGPLTFADREMAKKTGPFGGRSYAEQRAADRAGLMEEYDIKDSQEELRTYRRIGATLPEQMVTWVKGRDEGLKEVDRQINEAVAESLNTSDPLRKNELRDYINSLYMVRGTLTQSYVSRINTAIKEHSANLQSMTDALATNLENFNIEIESKALITKDQYDNYRDLLIDRYNNVKDAEGKRVALEYLKEQHIALRAKNVADAIKGYEQSSFFEDASDLRSVMLEGKGNYLKKTVNLPDMILEYKMYSPEIGSRNILKMGTIGVNNILYSDDDDITLEEKLAVGRKAMNELLDIAMNPVDEEGRADFPDTYMIAGTYANRISLSMSDLLVNKWNTGTTPADLWKSVESLHKKGTFGLGKGTVSGQEFIKNFEKQTKGVVDTRVAEAIYADFLRYITDNAEIDYTAGTPESFVEAYLYATQSTTDRDNLVPITTRELLLKIARTYMSMLLEGLISSKGISLQPE
jgi:hypothetical protein